MNDTIKIILQEVGWAINSKNHTNIQHHHSTEWQATRSCTCGAWPQVNNHNTKQTHKPQTVNTVITFLHHYRTKSYVQSAPSCNITWQTTNSPAVLLRTNLQSNTSIQLTSHHYQVQTLQLPCNNHLSTINCPTLQYQGNSPITVNTMQYKNKQG